MITTTMQITSTVAYLTLSSGETVAVLYQWTFGEMAVTASLLILTALTAVRFMYNITYQLWSWRKGNA